MLKFYFILESWDDYFNSILTIIIKGSHEYAHQVALILSIAFDRSIKTVAGIYVAYECGSRCTSKTDVTSY